VDLAALHRFERCRCKAETIWCRSSSSSSHPIWCGLLFATSRVEGWRILRRRLPCLRLSLHQHQHHHEPTVPLTRPNWISYNHHHHHHHHQTSTMSAQKQVTNRLDPPDRILLYQSSRAMFRLWFAFIHHHCILRVVQPLLPCRRRSPLLPLVPARHCSLWPKQLPLLWMPRQVRQRLVDQTVLWIPRLRALELPRALMGTAVLRAVVGRDIRERRGGHANKDGEPNHAPTQMSPPPPPPPPPLLPLRLLLRQTVLLFRRLVSAAAPVPPRVARFRGD
jgi:hypothetical protein